MATNIPAPPARNEDPWFDKRDAFDQAVRTRLNTELSDAALSATIADALVGYEPGNVEAAAQAAAAAYLATEPAVINAASLAAAPAVATELDAQIGDALVSANAVLGVSVRRIVAAPLGSSPTVADGDLVVYYDTPGANYYTDFRTTAAGSAPVGWTQLWGTTNWTVQNVADATGGKALVVNPVAQASQEFALTMDAVNSDPLRGNVEVLFRFRSSASNAVLLSAFARGAGNGVGSGANGWRLGHHNGTDLRVSSFSNGSMSAWAGVTVPAREANEWYLLRARVEGATQKVKVWKDGTAEPAWTVSDTKTNIPAAGAVGLMLSRYGNLGTNTIDWVAIATGGKTAVAQ